MTFEELMKEEFGYECKTTFWSDFSIADMFGSDAIEDTFNRAFEEWKSNVVYLTELVLVLNHKIWYHANKNESKARLYDKLWRKASEYAETNLKGVDYEYYFRMTD